MNLLMAVIAFIGAMIVCVSLGSVLLGRWADQRTAEALRRYVEEREERAA